MKYWPVILIVVLLAFIAITSIQDDEKRGKNKAVAKQPIVSTSSQKVYVDINLLIGKSPSVVSKILGKPNRVKQSNDCDKLPIPCKEFYYHADSIMIIYQNGLASYFDFQHMESFDFNDKMYIIFGLSEKTPDIIFDDVYWFQFYKEVKKVAFIKSKKVPGKISYAIITGY